MKEIKNSLEMAAAPDVVYKTLSDLDAWPHHLPHFRWIRVMENHPDHQIVRKACYRGGIPIDWVVRFETHPATRELRFTHQKAIMRGMVVIWRVEPLRDGTASLVTITYQVDLLIRRWGEFLVFGIIRKFFIDYVARKNLRAFASHFQKKQTGEALA